MVGPYISLNLSDAWAVLIVFLIPFGGGIPAGVLLARSRGIGWEGMTALYFLSDVILAMAFEPVLNHLIARSRRSAYFARVSAAFKQALRKTTAHYGKKGGPFALVMVAFGTDPMTGRVVARAAGHGFFVGWAIAIAGDMLYFALLMAATLWLRNVLGDGTWATVIILIVTMGVPPVLKRLRK